MKVLITCGPTWVKMDDVRVISNQSSGEMGHLIAAELLKQGVTVTLLEGAVTHVWSNPKVKVIKYRFFDELAKSLSAELKKGYDCVIHAAAVSDFVLAKPLKGKIDSSKALTLTLVPASKLIDQIKKIAPETFLVGFKLEPDFDVETTGRSSLQRIRMETHGLFIKSQCDLVVANSVNKGYQGLVVDADGQVLAKAKTKRKIAEALAKLL